MKKCLVVLCVTCLFLAWLLTNGIWGSKNDFSAATQTVAKHSGLHNKSDGEDPFALNPSHCVHCRSTSPSQLNPPTALRTTGYKQQRIVGVPQCTPTNKTMQQLSRSVALTACQPHSHNSSTTVPARYDECYALLRNGCIRVSPLQLVLPVANKKTSQSRPSVRGCNEGSGSSFVTPLRVLLASGSLPDVTAAPTLAASLHIVSCWDYYGYHLWLCLLSLTALYARESAEVGLLPHRSVVVALHSTVSRAAKPQKRRNFDGLWRAFLSSNASSIEKWHFVDEKDAMVIHPHSDSFPPFNLSSYVCFRTVALGLSIRTMQLRRNGASCDRASSTTSYDP